MSKLQNQNYTSIAAPCVIYDVFEKDPANKVIKRCESRTEAAEFLGLKHTKYISNIIQRKSRHKSIKLNKVITIR